MPQKSDYVEMVRRSLEGKRTRIDEADIDILCHWLFNYSGRDITDALRALHMNMLRELMASRAFVPVEIDGQVSDSAKQHVLQGRC